jgi:hypothetical protein
VPNKNLRLLFNFGQPPVERKTDRKWRNLFGTKTSVFDFISVQKQTTLSVFFHFLGKNIGLGLIEENKHTGNTVPFGA